MTDSAIPLPCPSSGLSNQAEPNRETDLAREVFRRTIGTLPAVPGVRHFQYTAGHFSGDVVLYCHSPRGELHLLVGDFTGHGLSAALGILPTAQVFNSMSKRGFPIREIVWELNHKLCTLLPTQLFLSAALLSYAPNSRSLTVWNLGLPPMLLFDRKGRITQRLAPRNLPLGLTPEVEGDGSQLFELGPDDHLLIYSDGLVELEQGTNRFDTATLEHLVTRCPSEQLLSQIESRVNDCLCGNPPADDITVVLIEGSQLERNTVPPPSLTPAAKEEACIPLGKFRLELEATLLKRMDPTPLLTGVLEQMGVPGRCRQAVFLILSELINNALEHGLLGLDSRLKQSAGGFTAYMQQRQERLARLQEGRIVVEIGYLDEPTLGQRQLEITVEDSGPGFDHRALDTPGFQENTGCHGRGILLLRSLCSEVTYQGRGNRVRVRYWLA